MRADDKQECSPSDFPWLGGHALVMRQKAFDQLKDIWDATGEMLPLETGDGLSLYVFNAQVVDALDENNSTIIRFPGTNRIMRIKKIAFIRNMVERLDVFRLSHRASPTFVSEMFIKRFKEAGLVGLEFNAVTWYNLGRLARFVGRVPLHPTLG